MVLGKSASVEAVAAITQSTGDMIFDGSILDKITISSKKVIAVIDSWSILFLTGTTKAIVTASKAKAQILVVKRA